MKRLHQRLIHRYPWYDAWHRRGGNSLIHWLLLVVVVLGSAAWWYGETVRLAQEHITLQANIASLHKPTKDGVLGRSPEHILIAFSADLASDRRTGLLKRRGFTELSAIAGTDTVLLKLPPGLSPERAVDILTHDENDSIAFAEVDAILAPSDIPGDPGYASEWHLPFVNAPAAWDTARGSGVLIAVLDTGIDATHPDLASQMVSGWNVLANSADVADTVGHGTAVAGTIAAARNDIGVVGLAYGARILPIRVGDQNGNATYSAIASAITYAADHGAKIANISYRAGGSSAVQRAASYLRKLGGLTVVAEGNTGGASEYRASAALISVAATDNTDRITSWSTYGSDVDIAAPGQAIFTTANGGGTVYYSGTSFATPLVSAMLALIWSANPTLSPDQAEQALFSSAVDLGTAGRDDSYGWGRIDAASAVAVAGRASTVVGGGGKGRK